MYKQEDPAVMAIVLDEAFNGVEVLCSLRVCPVGHCVFDFTEVCEFGLRFASYPIWM